MRKHECHCNNEFCNFENSVKLLESERDRLKAELEEVREQDRLCHVNINIWKNDRDLWKSKAEKLAEVLRECSDHLYSKQDTDRVKAIAKAALAAFERGDE